jgi:hypothetical protein
MLILGFSDNFGYYQSSFNQDRLQAIVDYADSGKCVLFSHDCTNWENGSGQNGKLNMTIRDLTGLDRYGVTVYRTTNSALFNSNNKIKDGLEIVKSSLSELTDYLFGASGLNGYNRDIAFKANTNQTAMVKETQAITYSGSEHNMSDTNKASLYRYLGYSSSLDGTWINQNDTQIEKVNQGAITEYPYRLSDTISVSQTHAQYYQLDLESDSDEDGEGDIVVWYTINNSVKGTLNDIYDYSPNDVRNNYYIYNRGNITYTGMGHSNIDGNAEEIRLFINTMIAAYRVSMKSPILNIVESPTDLTDKSYASVPYDAAVDNNATTYRVYFTAEDNNFISDAAKVINYKLYVADGAGDTEITPSAGVTEKVSEKTGQWKVYLASNDTEALSLTSGEVYYVDVPLDESFINKKSVDLYVEVQAEITKRNKVETSAKVYDSIKINQLQLFDLD